MPIAIILGLIDGVFGKISAYLDAYIRTRKEDDAPDGNGRQPVVIQPVCFVHWNHLFSAYSSVSILS